MPQKLKDLVSTAQGILAMLVLLITSAVGGAVYSDRLATKVENASARLDALERYNTIAHKQLDESLLKIEIYFQYMSNRLEKIKL